MSIRKVVADELNERRDYRYGYVNPEDVRSVEVRRGGVELDVEFMADEEQELLLTETIPIESVLTELLREALDFSS